MAVCDDNPYIENTPAWQDYATRNGCIDTSTDTSTDTPWGSSTDQSFVPSFFSTSNETSPQGSASGSAPSKSVIKGLQSALNRALVTPIGVDGVLGNITLGAVKTIIAWMPNAGYDTSTIVSLVGTNPTVASIAGQAAALSNLIDWIANDYGFSTGTSSAPSVPAARTGSGKVPAVPVLNLPQGQSQKAASLLGLGLPDWAVYTGGVALLAGIAWLVIGKKKHGDMHGPDRFIGSRRTNPYGDRNMNALGLTFHRWWRAAGFSSERKVPTAAYDAWAAGEDPSDWRAERQR